MLRNLLSFTLLFSSLVISSQGFAQTSSPIVTETTTTTAKNSETQAIEDPRLIAEKFIEHISHARIALSMKDSTLAKDQILRARAMVNELKKLKIEQRKITKVQSGRIMYEYNTEVKDYYFPIEKVETGPMEVKSFKNGPSWADNKATAVTDAEIVYLSLDLTGDKTEKTLEEAIVELDKGNLLQTQKSLADLVAHIVTVDATLSVPLDKALDNIALTKQFISAQNYEGARFTLRHADNAIATLELDERYAAHRNDFKTLRRELVFLEESLMRKDIAMLKDVDKKLIKWWQMLKTLPRY